MEFKKTQKQLMGALGEELASKYLKNKGFSVVTRNYRKKFGEIDIIAEKWGRIYFVEVKTVSCENVKDLTKDSLDAFRPEDNVHAWKLRRLSNAIRVYLAEQRYGAEREWQFDVVTVLLDEKNKVAKISRLKDIIL